MQIDHHTLEQPLEWLTGHWIKLGLAVFLLASAQPVLAPTNGYCPHCDFVVAVVAQKQLLSETTTIQRTKLNDVVDRLRRGDTKGVNAVWSLVFETYVPRRDVDTLIHWVLRQTYLASNQDLLIAAADKVRYYNDLKKVAREESSEMKQAIIDLQNILQKQQQLVQSMSGVSEMLRDTAMVSIRKTK